MGDRRYKKLTRKKLKINWRTQFIKYVAPLVCIFSSQLFASVSPSPVQCFISAKPQRHLFLDETSGRSFYSKRSLENFEDDISTKQCFGICYAEAFAASVERNIRMKGKGQYSVDRLSLILEALKNRYDFFEQNLYEKEPDKIRLKHMGITRYVNIEREKAHVREGDREVKDHSSIYGGTNYSMFPYQKGDRQSLEVKGKFETYLVRRKNKSDVEFEDMLMNEFSSKLVSSEKHFLEEELLRFYREYNNLAYRQALQINTKTLINIRALNKIFEHRPKILTNVEKAVLTDWLLLMGRHENFSELESAKIVVSFLEKFPVIQSKLIHQYVFENDDPAMMQMSNYYSQLEAFYKNFQIASAKRLVGNFRKNLDDQTLEFQEKMLAYWRGRRKGERVHLRPIEASIEVKLEGSHPTSRLFQEENLLRIENALLAKQTVMLSFNYLGQNLHPSGIENGFKNFKKIINPEIAKKHYDEYSLDGNHMEEVLHLLRDTETHEIKYVMLRGNHGFDESWSGKYLLDIDYFHQNYASHDILTVTKVEVKKESSLSKATKKAWDKLLSILKQ